jgi:hypothetical protein
MELPVRATISEWNEQDQLGWLMTERGARVRFGASACTDVRPTLGLACWLVELKPDPITKGVRAKVISATGVSELDKVAQSLAAAERARVEKERERERLRAVMALPHALYLDEIERSVGPLPALYLRMDRDGVACYGDDPDGYSVEQILMRPRVTACLCADARWLHPYEIAERWRAATNGEVTFAREGRGAWSWMLQNGQEVWYRAQAEESELYAPDLEACMFRWMLEALLRRPATMLDRTPLDLTKERAFLQRCIDDLQSYVRPHWLSLLSRLAQRPDVEREVTDNDMAVWRFVDEPTHRAILARELGNVRG